MGNFSFDWQAAWSAVPILLKGVPVTLEISFAGLLLGFVIGMFAGLMRLSRHMILRWPAIAYVELFRGTPVIVQVLFIYYGLPSAVGEPIPALAAAIAAIAFNSGAYISEIVRGGVQSIAKGQREAGFSLGLSKVQTFYYVLWPVAFRRMIPALGNQSIISVKDTSIFTIIGVTELVQQGRIYIANTFNSLETYFMVAMLYLIITLTMTMILRFIESRSIAENI